VFLLSMSGVYHMMARGGTARLVLERLDHGAIFVFIAGSCTPAHGLLFRGWYRLGSLFLVWTAALSGITLKTVYFDSLPEWLGLTSYLALGWLGAFSAVHLGLRHGFAFVQPLLLGGVAFSIGAALDYLGWPVLVPGLVHAHELFHLVVLAGMLLHWWFIWRFATGEVRMPKRPARSPARRPGRLMPARPDLCMPEPSVLLR
jgi:hemolysin III